MEYRTPTKLTQEDKILAQCGKQFTATGSLKTHISTIHEGQKFQCPHCEHKSAYKGDLQRHIQGVPFFWAHFVFVIFSGSRVHTEELFIAIG